MGKLAKFSTKKLVLYVTLQDKGFKSIAL